MINVYELGFKISKYVDNKKLLKYHSESMGRVHCAKELRSIHLDYGRQTGKTMFALDFLNKNWGNCIVVAPTYNLCRMLREQYRHQHKLMLFPKDFGDIVSMDASKSSMYMAFLSGRNEVLLRTRDLLRNADYVIFDEPGFCKPQHLDEIYNFCKDTATFIHLGRPRK